jgi:hypothetical protein
MAKPKSGGPPPPNPAEIAALKKVTKFTFGVVPVKVQINGTVTANWNVTIPQTGFDIFIKLNGVAVAASGTQTFKMTKNTTFSLGAAIDDEPPVGRILKSQVVVVNLSDCKDFPFGTYLITNKLKDTLDGSFSGNGQFSFRDGTDMTQLTVGDGTLDINIPLTLNVPDWFDADMDIHVQLMLGGSSGVVIVEAPVVQATVDWSLLSAILSGGCSDAVGAGMSKLAQVFVEQIVDAQIRPGVAQGLQNLVNASIASAHSQDPQQRTFVMSTLIFSKASGIVVSVCPTT